MHLLLTAVLLAAPPPTSPDPSVDVGVQTAPVPPDGPPPVVRPLPAAGDTAEEPLKLLGVQLTAGAPQGFGAAAVIRPLPWLRGSFGFAHNVLGPGIQGSLTAIPFRWSVAPSLTLEAGKFFETDVSDDFSGTFPEAFDPALQKFGYEFYSAQLGLEFGSQRSFSFFVRGGLAWVRSGLDDVRNYRPSGSNTTVDVSGLKLRATVPTVNLGFLLYVW
jgi:hypothetical protein